MLQASEKVKSVLGGKFVICFEDLRKEDIPLVGGKNANLGRMINACWD